MNLFPAPIQRDSAVALYGLHGRDGSVPSPTKIHPMTRKRYRYLLPILCVAAAWLPARAQQFLFEFKGPALLAADNNCEAILALHPDSLTVQSAIGATVTDTVLSITGQYQLGDTLPAGTVVTLNWLATDDQGNDSLFVFTITVTDQSAPNFSSALPPDLTVDCPNVPAPATVTIFDNCDDQPVLEFEEADTYGSCAGGYTISRQWTARDAAGNSRTHSQTITVLDTLAPQLIGVPGDTVVDCQAIPGLPVVTATDGCDTLPELTFANSVLPGSCPANYIILRTWTATDDCGNTAMAIQTITVQDTLAPQLIGVPTDTVVDCDQVFPPLPIGPGGVTATDLCDTAAVLTFSESDNRDPDPTQCDHLNYEILRTWTATDACGNSAALSQTVQVRDRVAPTLFCPTGDSIAVSTGSCTTEGVLARILFASENCVPSASAVLSDTALILNTSGTPLLSGVVDTVTFDLPWPGLPGRFATGPVNLSIDLLQADAEQPGEFYFVQGEDGSLLGQTVNTPAQCGSAQTLLQTLSAEQVNAWTSDGTLTLRLLPNGSGVEAINQICPNGRVAVTVAFGYLEAPPAPLTLSYRIGGGPVKLLGSSDTLAAGNHDVHLYATDCSGNTDSCTYPLVVFDAETPTLACPPAQDISTDSTQCLATLALPFPLEADDNCALGTPWSETIPTAFLPFVDDPNAGKVPADVTANFGPAPAAGTGTGILRVWLTGDLDHAGEFFTVFAEDGSVLGNTAIDPAKACSGEIETAFVIDNQRLRDWSADGTLGFRLESNKDVINFSDLIGPCGPLVPGGTDNVSTVRLELSYAGLELSYRIEDLGANTVASGLLGGPSDPATVNLAAGSYLATYSVEDEHGNRTSCSYPIDVRDMVPPQLQCKLGLFVRTNPSGLVTVTVNEDDLLAVPAFDHCGIAQVAVSPSSFTCEQAGQNFTVQVVASDAAGNTDTCRTIVAVQNEGLMPMFTLDTCGGNLRLLPDTTFTWPTPGSGGFFTYLWTSSNGFFSNDPSPVIADPKESDSGTYLLTVQGLTGCVSTGSVSIDIGPSGVFRPLLETNSPVCQGDSIRLSTAWLGGTSYLWRHIPSGKETSTTEPFLVLPANFLNAGEWTLSVLQGPGCPSSDALPREVVVQPISLQLTTDSIAACAGDSLQFQADGFNIATFTWTSPSGKTYSGSQPAVALEGGTWLLRADSPQGCVLRDTLTAVLRQRPVIDALTEDCPTCVGGTESCTLTPTLSPPDSAGIYRYTWTSPLGQTISTDSLLQLVNLTGASSGNYSLQVSLADNTCSSERANIFLALNDIPLTPQIGPDGSDPSNPLAACEGGTVVLGVKSGAYSGNVHYLWEGPLGTDTTATPSLTLTPLTLADAGTYTLGVTVNGCPSNPSNAQLLEVNPIPATPAITGATDLCEGDTLQLCTPFLTDAVWEWNGPGGLGGQSNCITIHDIGTDKAGEYRVRIAVKGCFSDLTEPLTVIVRERPQIPVIGDDCGGRVCRDQAAGCNLVVLNPASDTEWAWFEHPSGAPYGSPGNDPELALALPGNFTEGSYGFFVVATGGNGCRSLPSAVHNIVVNTIPNISADAGEDKDFCFGDPATLCAQQPSVGTGSWQQAGGPAVTLLDPAAACTGLSGQSGGDQLTLVWKLSNGACVDYSIDTVQVVISRFEEAAADTLLRLCRAQEVQLEAQAGLFGPGVWSQPAAQSSAGVSIGDPTSPTSPVNGLQPGTAYVFTWTLPNGACPDDAVEVAVVNFDDEAYAGTDREDCGQGCLTLPLVADFATLGGGRWIAPDASITLTPSGETAATACGLQHGPNVFVWELNDGLCGESAYDTLVVDYSLGPVAFDDSIRMAFAGQALIPVLDNDTRYDAVITEIVGLPGEGSMKELSDGVFLYTPPATFTGTTEFRYRVCSAECPDVCTEGRILIEVEENTACEVPTIITPNGDGVNDALVIPCLAVDGLYPRNALSVFNQWGDEVYRSGPYANDWQGTYDGRALPSGTYFFVFTPGDGTPASSGFLLIKP